MEAELVDVAARAGVKFIQAQTNGLDHVEVDKIRDAGMMLAHCPGELSSIALAQSAMMFLLLLAHDYGNARQNFAAGKFFFHRDANSMAAVSPLSDSGPVASSWPAAPSRLACVFWRLTCDRSNRKCLTNFNRISWADRTIWTASSQIVTFCHCISI